MRFCIALGILLLLTGGVQARPVKTAVVNAHPGSIGGPSTKQGGIGGQVKRTNGMVRPK